MFNRIAIALMLPLMLAPVANAEDLDAWSAEAGTLLKTRVDNKWNVGAVCGLITADGRRVMGFGKIRTDSDAAPDGDTLYEVGSISKLFTGLILADMSNKGELKLTDTLESCLPAGCKVGMKGSAVTLLSLAHHNSGLPRVAPDEGANPLHPKDQTPQELYAWLANWKPATAPGEKYEYSNLGYAALGQALANKAGADYETLLRTRICQALDLKDTVVKLSPELKARHAPGYSQIFVPVAGVDETAMPGAGAVSSTVNDLLKLLSVSMGLSSSSIDADIKLALSERELTEKKEQWRGLGWHIDLFKDKKEFIWKNGQDGGFNTFLGFVPDKKIGVVILSNTRSDIMDIGVHLLNSDMPVNGFKKKARPEHTIVAAKPETYVDYAGQYDPAGNAEKRCTVSIIEGHLFVQSRNQGSMELQSEGNDAFICNMPAQTTFKRDAAGKVTGFTFHNESKDEPDVTFEKVNGAAAAP